MVVETVSTEFFLNNSKLFHKDMIYARMHSFHVRFLENIIYKSNAYFFQYD